MNLNAILAIADLRRTEHTSSTRCVVINDARCRGDTLCGRSLAVKLWRMTKGATFFGFLGLLINKSPRAALPLDSG